MSDNLLQRAYQNTVHCHAKVMVYLYPDGRVDIAPFYVVGDLKGLPKRIAMNDLIVDHMQYAMLTRPTPWDHPLAEVVGPFYVSYLDAPFTPLLEGVRLEYRPVRMVTIPTLSDPPRYAFHPGRGETIRLFDGIDIHGEELRMDGCVSNELIEDSAIDAFTLMCEDFVRTVHDSVKRRQEQDGE